MSRASLPARAAALLVLLPATAASADGVFDVLKQETDWTLFHPTPRPEMRRMTVDTLPYTLDAGHVQVEVDVIDADWDRRQMRTERRIDVLGFNARVGLTDQVDLQLHWVPFRAARYEVNESTMADGKGIGDTRLRLALNLWGNHGGISAAAIMPFIRLPTATGGVGTGAFEGGVVVPLTIEIPAGFELRGVVQAEFADDRGGTTGVHPRFAVTAGIGREVLGPVTAAVEWTYHADVQNNVVAEYEVSALGTVAIARDLQLDVGASVGVPDTSARIHPYLRMTVRR